MCVGYRLYKRLKDEHYTCKYAFVQGSDVFRVLPTQFGKSLCFASLPSVFDRSDIIL